MMAAPRPSSLPDARGHFGPYGGRFVPETLMAPLVELETAYARARRDRPFQAELSALLADYAGRPTPLYFARRLSEHAGGVVVIKPCLSRLGRKQSSRNQ